MGEVVESMADSVLACAILSGMLFLLAIVIRYCRKPRHFEIPARDVGKGHRWRLIDLFLKPTHCNVSRVLLTDGGAECECCGVCAEEDLMRVADREIVCKDLASRKDPYVHHWLCGNLPESAACVVCGRECGGTSHLVNFRCCWCSRCVHTDCLQTVKQEACDFGPHASSIIPPNCVRIKQVGLKGRRHWVVCKASRPRDVADDWRPLVVVANRKSGSNGGGLVLRAFRRLLNPAQVLDLADVRAEAGLEWCRLLPGLTFRLLVAGGDGTIGWVLSAIDKLNISPPPEVAILPLGTGNDLSRVLGWGQGQEGDIDCSEVLKQIEHSTPVQLDRWHVSIHHQRHFGLALPGKTLVMNNYLSLGVDALVTLNFHRQRESRPCLFGSRLINKLWYLTYGTKDVLERECKDLDKKLTVEVDGRELVLPSLEGVVVLNIASWGAGVRPWVDDDSHTSPSRFDDGLLEVIGLYSSFHIAQLQVGLAQPLKLAQGSSVKLSLRGSKTPMQVDGEPWEQHPSDISISFHNHANMLMAHHNT